jgi:hypothetical protein
VILFVTALRVRLASLRAKRGADLTSAANSLEEMLSQIAMLDDPR